MESPIKLKEFIKGRCFLLKKSTDKELEIFYNVRGRLNLTCDAINENSIVTIKFSSLVEGDDIADILEFITEPIISIGLKMNDIILNSEYHVYEFVKCKKEE